MLRKSQESLDTLAAVRNEANINGNEIQLKKLEQRFRDSGIYREE